MSRENWTPGPWRAIPWHVEEGSPAVGCAEGWIVATTESYDDARLISAAPELYAALERCCNYIANTESEFGMELECGRLARAALAKARGEHA